MTIATSPVHFPLVPGDMITIMWSGEPRMVVIAAEDGALVLRDLTEAEAEDLAEDIAAAERAPS